MFSGVPAILLGGGGGPMWPLPSCIGTHNTGTSTSRSHHTGNPLDLKIEGPPDFTVQGPLAQTPQTYSKFNLGPDCTGMFKLAHYEARTVGKQVIGTLLKYFLVETFPIMYQRHQRRDRKGKKTCFCGTFRVKPQRIIPHYLRKCGMNFYHYRLVIPQIKLDITISTVPPILSFYILAEGCRQGMSLTDYNWLISLVLFEQ